MSFVYRDYQLEAIQSVFDYFDNGNAGNPCLAMPTGTGKSPVGCGLIHRVMSQWPSQRIMMLTHVKELIEQNYKTMNMVWPNAPIGVYSSGLNQKDIAQPVIFGGVQSVVNVAEAFGHRDLLLIDEAHLLSPKDDTMYQNVIQRLKGINPYLKVIGLTATPYRLGQGMMTDDGLFTDICFDVTGMDAFNRFIYEGYLSPLIAFPTETEYDVSNLDLHNGDFVQNQLQAAVDVKEITKKVLEETLAKGYTRKCWLVFASGIKHAEHVAEMLNLLGIRSAAIHSKTKNRDDLIKAHKSGLITCLVNNNVLTTGYDNPLVDLIVYLRPTMSPGLHVQMLGRGTRPVYITGYDLSTAFGLKAHYHVLSTLEGRLNAIANGPKQNCLVLDFAGNTRRLGPINDPLKPKNKRKVCDCCGEKNLKAAKICVKCGSELASGDAPIKICPGCNAYNHASARTCCNCGLQFEIREKLVATASTVPIIKQYEPPIIEWYDVDRVLYTKEVSKSKGICYIKVSYFSGLLMFNEVVCLEHGGHAAKNARDWWRERFNLFPEVPVSTDEALKLIHTHGIRTPIKVKVHVNKTYPQVLSWQFA